MCSISYRLIVHRNSFDSSHHLISDKNGKIIFRLSAAWSMSMSTSISCIVNGCYWIFRRCIRFRLIFFVNEPHPSYRLTMLCCCWTWKSLIHYKYHSITDEYWLNTMYIWDTNKPRDDSSHYCNIIYPWSMFHKWWVLHHFNDSPLPYQFRLNCMAMK